MFPQIDPVFFSIGPLSVHWYGVTYLVGLALGWGLLSWRIKKSSHSVVNAMQLSDMIFYIAMGIILGGRVGYILFYQWSAFLADPVMLLKIWQGGMSFHGGLIGVLVALWIYGKTINKTMIDLTDFIAPVVPIGLGAGRIGNFINGELWGRVTDAPWGMVFPNTEGLPRHPSQLYEFFLEGIVMFLVLWFYSSKPRPRWAVSALFLILYSLFRFTVEFFREPDSQIGYIAFGWLTKGQLLSLPMFIIGVVMFVLSNRGKLKCSNT